MEFLLPDVGEGLAEATVLRWLVAVGDPVEADAPLVEIETDKAVMEIPAPRAGVVLHHGAAEGDVVEIGSLLVVIGDSDEVWRPVADAPAAEQTAPSAPAPVVGTLDGPDVAPGVTALPAVRRLASELGVDLGAIRGSGPGGRVTRADVEAAAGSSGSVERVPLSPTRAAIARNLTRSWHEIPHVTTYGEADAEPMLAARAAIAETSSRSVPLEALLIRAVTPLLEEFAEFNAACDDDHLLLRRHYDVGFAVDTPDGLMVAVVRNADGLVIGDLVDEVHRLAAAARERTATAAELRGATFTISNIGAVGGGYGTPIIPFGTTAILSVGRADPRPVVRDGSVVAARVFPLSLSYDHRVIDGARGRAFLAATVAALEGVEGA
ncbi:MAG TPA: dihydrolipoamide acetyltransferase family protein [Acidimicrobiia bacterium]|nr:dihydrolipoamide acetyltransferase family protein [Acidimicrobiia bacterium]